MTLRLPQREGTLSQGQSQGFRVLSNAFHDPQIEVLSGGAPDPSLLRGLSAVGYRPVVTSLPLEKATAVPVLVDLDSFSERHATALGPVLLEVEPRPIVLFGSASKTSPHLAGAVQVTSLDKLHSLRVRLELRRRSLLRENECVLRRQTEAEFDDIAYGRSETNGLGGPKVLYIGGIGPEHLALSRGMQARGIDLLCAITTSLARQHLDTETIHLVVVGRDAPEDTGDLLAPLEGRLPVFFAGDLTMPHPDGILDFKDMPEIAYDHIAARLQQPRLRTRRRGIKLSSRSHDALTGLYSPTFLMAHLPRQMRACGALQTPMALIHIRVRDDRLERSEIIALAEVFDGNVRETDFVVRLDHSQFLIVLRDTAYAGGASLKARIAESIGRHPELGPQIAARLLWRITERRGSFTPETLVKTATSGPFSRLSAA